MLNLEFKVAHAIVSRSRVFALLVVVGIFTSLNSCRITTSPIQSTAVTAVKATDSQVSNRETQRVPRTRAERPLWTATDPNPALPSTALETDMYAAEAPEFPSDLIWFNPHQATTLAALRGKVTILMFWSYRCIDCLYVFQDLQRLQAEYPNDLAIVSIHSEKLETDDDLQRVRQTIANYEADYPTINDEDLGLWYDWGVQGIPTLIIIDPIGTIYGFHNGTHVYKDLKPIINLFARPEAND